MQARMGSTRLPGKVLKKVLGKPLLLYQIERLRRVALATNIVIATTSLPQDQVIVDLCKQHHIPVFCGSEEDVLNRYYLAAKQVNADVVVRVTADCPLIDPEVVNKIIAFYLNHFPRYQYVSNTLDRTFPRGMDTEVFSFKALEQAFTDSKRPEEREHVTPYIYQNPQLFNLANVAYESNQSDHRWTVDTQEDFDLISAIITALYPTHPNFSMEDVLDLLKARPDWIKINAHVRQK